MLKFYKIDDLKYFTDYAVAWRGSIQSKDRVTGRINPAEAYRIAHWVGGAGDALGFGADAMDDRDLSAFERLGIEGKWEREEFLRDDAGEVLGIATVEDQLIKRGKNSIPAYGFTFSAPKSVSVLWALADDPNTRQCVLDAHLVAVDTAMAWMEAQGATARRGHGGRDGHVSAKLIGGAFLHLDSREQDPQIHSHVVLLNAGLGEDGKWSTVDSRTLLMIKQGTDAIYSVALRSAMTEMLGVEWGVDDGHNQRELKGLDPQLLRHFSRRSRAIEQELERTGTAGPRARDAAALATRPTKPDIVEGADLHNIWRREAEARGFKQSDLNKVLNQARNRGKRLPEWVRSDIVDKLLGSQGLTRNVAAFTYDTIIFEAALIAPSGISLDDLYQIADDVLSSPEIVELAVVDPQTGIPLMPGQTQHDRTLAIADNLDYTGTGRKRWTTKEMLATEAKLLDALSSRGYNSTVSAQTIDVEIEAFSLSGEQEAMVRGVLSDDQMVSMVSGAPGAGKTHALRCCARAWEASGYHVLGTAVSAAAAKNLGDGAGIESYNTASFLERLARDELTLDNHTVIVADEASMYSTRQLAHLVEQAQSVGAKLVLVGDPYQLPPVESGGVWHKVVRSDNKTGIYELKENQRQVASWTRDAIANLRAGQVGMAVAAFQSHGWITVAESHQEAVAALLAKWQQHKEAGEKTLLAAYSRDMVNALNSVARGVLVEQGQLGTTLFSVDADRHHDLPEREFAIGDEIICLRNNSSIGVKNGERAIVQGVVDSKVPSRRRLVVALGNGKSVNITPEYLTQHVDYGYAVTLHKSQGQTVGTASRARSDVDIASEHGWVGILGSENLSAEAALVAVSRATDETDLVTVIAPTTDPCWQHNYEPELEDEIEIEIDPADRLIHAWSNSQMPSAGISIAEDATYIAKLARMDRADLVAYRDTLAKVSVVSTLDMEGKRNELAEQLKDTDKVVAARAATELEALERIEAVAKDWATETGLGFSDATRELARVDAGLDRERRARILSTALVPPEPLVGLIGEPDVEDRASWLSYLQQVGRIEDMVTRVRDNRQRSASPQVQNTATKDAVYKELATACNMDDFRPLDELTDPESLAVAMEQVNHVLVEHLPEAAKGVPAIERQVAVALAIDPEHATERIIAKLNDPTTASFVRKGLGAAATVMRNETSAMVHEAQKIGRDVPAAVYLATRPGWGWPDVRTAMEMIRERKENEAVATKTSVTPTPDKQRITLLQRMRDPVRFGEPTPHTTNQPTLEHEALTVPM
jgi:conjugative relaxase-like TrwC/TraI family protein